MHLLNKEKVNSSLAPKIVDARVTQIFNTFDKVMVTSSFGTTSAVLLHIISRVKPGCPIYFIDTGYHFEETLTYKRQLSIQLKLNLIELQPDPVSHEQTRKRKLWNDNPDRCCEINKLEPLEQIKSRYSVWMSGLIGFQSHSRSGLSILEDKSDMLKFYPLIDWNKHKVDGYLDMYGLPRHPLEKFGYTSIGCTHCTEPGFGREGRWTGTSKTECGLHR